MYSNYMRRSKEDADKTKQDILDAALKVFYKKGVTRATLNEVAKEAGVTRGAVYWHFKDKYDLYFTLYRTLTEQFEVRPEDYMAKKYSSLIEFKMDINKLFHTFEENREYHMFIQIMYSRMEYIEEMKPVIINEQKIQKAMLSAFERALNDLKSCGQVDKTINCKLYSTIIFALIDGIFDSWGIDEELFSGDSSVYKLIDEIFKNFNPKNN